MNPRRHTRSGFALPAVLLFLAISFGMWAIVFRSAGTTLRVEEARVHRDTHAKWLAPAVAAGLRLLETGLPPADSYSCKFPITQDEQTRDFLLTFEYVTAHRWTVACRAATDDDIAPDAPATFFVVPDAPADLSADAQSSQIDLTWSDVYYDDGYVIERSDDGVSGWSQIGTTARNITVFADTNVSAATTYYYRVHATNAAGNSAYSDNASAMTQ